jgi:hypothetical protein
MTAALICMSTVFSGSAVADDEGGSSSKRSPLLPNFYPAAGQWALESGLIYDEMIYGTGFKFSKTVAQEKLGYGFSNQTAAYVSQKYMVEREPLPKNRFYSPEISITHRFTQVKNEILSTTIAYTPKTDNGIPIQSKEQLRLGMNYSKLLDNEIWQSSEVSYSHTSNRLTDEFDYLPSTVNVVSAKFGFAKKIDKITYRSYLEISKKFDYKAIPIYKSSCSYHAPACTAYVETGLIPSLGIEASRELFSKTFVNFAYLVSQQNRTSTVYSTGLPSEVRSTQMLTQVFGIYLINEF